jgi:hypothetical protein
MLLLPALLFRRRPSSRLPERRCRGCSHVLIALAGACNEQLFALLQDRELIAELQELGAEANEAATAVRELGRAARSTLKVRTLHA